MSRIVGYTAKNLPKWPFILTGIILLCWIVLYLLVTSYDENNKPIILTTSTLATTTTIKKMAVTILSPSTTILKPITTTLQARPKSLETADITVEQIVFAKTIEEHGPVDSFKKIKKDEVSRVYCYTMVVALTVPQEIRHVWIDPSGNQIADIYLTISSQTGYTYSYITLSEPLLGKWQVQVKDFAGTTLAKSDFTISE